MYKVCFADDEIMNHQLLEKLVDWEKYGFEIVGKATDGVEALQLYEEQKPDLFLIDIKMPCMDGLECAKLIREADSKIKIVIVSAYSEFTYAQKAIQYGVQDFVVKPISRIVLNKLVEKIKQMLDKEREDTDEGDFIFPKIRQAIADGKLEAVLEGKEYDKFFSASRKIAYLRLFGPDGSSVNWAVTRNAASALEEFADKKNGAGEVRIDGHGKILVTVTDHKSIQEFMYDWNNANKYIVDMFLLEKAAYRQEVCRFFKQSYCGENPGFYKTNGSIFRGNIDEYYRDDYKIDSSRILEYFDLNQGTAQLKNYFETLIFDCKKENISPALLKNSILDSLVILKLKLKDYFGEDAFYMLRDIKVNELSSIDKAIYLKDYVNRIIDKLKSWIAKAHKEDSREMQVIKKANQYAKDNFMRVDFAVQEAADFVGLSRNYFVTVYKEYANRGYWDYVTELRIEKASQLLMSTDWPIAYIARYVGYESEYHFSRKFKGIVGVSPSKYRKSE